jgi:hypothetical protein
MERITRAAIEAEHHTDNTNREEAFCLSKSRKPLFQTMKERKKALSK